jgi:hypothetical protein
MRAPHVLLLACIATLFIAGASAQTSGHSALTADIKVEGLTHLMPGDFAKVNLVATRICANQAQILPAGTLQVRVVGSSGAITVTGPTSAAMPQQMCAQQETQVVALKLTATARTDLSNFTTIDETLVFQVHVDAQDATNPPPNDAVVSTLFVVRAPEHTIVAAAMAEKPAPAEGLLLGIGGLALVAAVVRRRA